MGIDRQKDGKTFSMERSHSVINWEIFIQSFECSDSLLFLPEKF